MAIARMMVEAAQWAADQFAAGKPGNRAVRNAFIAWWACEDGYDWPTNSRNNPGNLRPAGDDTGSVGITASNFYIYATPGDGVAMHVQRVKRSAHYPMIRSAISQVANGQAGPAAIADAVGRSPWGTNAPCMRSALGSIASQIDYSPSPTGTGWATVHRLGRSSFTGTSGVTLVSTTQPLESAAIPVRAIFLQTFKKEPTAALDSYYADAWVQFVLEARGTGGDWKYFPWLSPAAADLEALLAQTRTALSGAIRPMVGTAYGKLPETVTVSLPKRLASDPITAVADAIAQLPEAAGNVVVHLVPVVAAVVLVVLGLYVLATSK